MFCKYCGFQINNGQKFCKQCGKPSDEVTVSSQETSAVICSRCGAVVGSFDFKCRYCGSEIIGKQAVNSVKEFSGLLTSLSTWEQKITLIKTFPIPNTKEDIFEYMILASSHIGYEKSETPLSEEYENAWSTKFIQCFQKAKLIFDDSNEFEKIGTLFRKTMARVDQKESKQTIIRILTISIKNIGAVIGIFLAYIAVLTDNAGDNSSIIESLAVIASAVSAHALSKRKTFYIEYAISAINGLFLLIMASALDNGSFLQLGAIIVLIITAINFFRKLI